MLSNLNLKDIENKISVLSNSHSLMMSVQISNNILTEMSNLVRVRDLALLSADSSISKFNPKFVPAINILDNSLRLKFATTNPFKLKEFIEYSNNDIIFKCISNCFSIGTSVLEKIDVDETETSFAYNASLKSKQYSEYYNNSMILSEDSGIIVPCINNFPGVISARHGLMESSINIANTYLSDNEIKNIKDKKDILNNITLLLHIYDKFKDTAIPDFVHSIVSTTASVSISGSEISNHTGTINGFIDLTQIKDFISDGNEQKFEKLVASCSGFGYNPIFRVAIDHGERPYPNANVLTSLEDTSNMFIHRRNAFNSVLLSALYSVLS